MGLNKPWNEPLLIKIGGSVYLKLPTEIKCKYPEVKSKNPTTNVSINNDTVKLVYAWKIDKTSNVVQ